jgi:RHH-type rel operon transcriptional repressor/antitoxin RelB
MSLTVRLPDELNFRLSSLAQQTGRSKSFYVRKAIEDKLDDFEDLYLGLAVLEDVRTGKEKLLTSEEMWDGLDD